MASTAPERRTAAQAKQAAKKPTRMDQFLERQWDHKAELRRKCALIQKELYEESRKDSEVLLWGAQGVEGFRKFLAARFGTVACAWRTALDPCTNGKIAWGELRQACHDLGYHGNMKKLWAEISEDEFVTLASLDKEAYDALTDFRDLCTEKYGSTLEAWKKAINPKNEPKVQEDAFCERCKAMGYSGNPKKLLHWLRTDMARKELTLHDFDPHAAGAVCRADPCAESISAVGGNRLTASHTPKAALSPLARRAAAKRDPFCLDSTGASNLSRSGIGRGTLGKSRKGSQPDLPPTWSVPPTPSKMSSRMASSATDLMLRSPGRESQQEETFLPSDSELSLTLGQDRRGSSPSGDSAGHLSPTRTSGWIRELSEAQILERKAVKEEHMEAIYGIKTPSDFRAAMITQYGSVVSAWQQFYDPHSKGKVSYNDLCDRAREVGYLGDSRQLWAALGGEETGVLKLSDLDPEAASMIEEFRTVLTMKFGNMLQAWTQDFDPEGQGHLSKKAFERKCVEHGLKSDPAKLFKLLQDKNELGDRQRRKLTLREFDPQAFKAFNRSDFEMLTEGHGRPVSPLTQTFEQRQEGTFTAKWARTQSEQTRTLHRSMIDHETTMDRGCHGLGDLRELLVRKYGNMALAWRIALDPLGQLQLSREELAKRARAVGFNGDIRLLWAQLAKPEKGHVTLHDFDADAAELLWNFRSFLLKKYPDLIAAWQQGLDPNKTNRLDEEEFVRSCEHIGFDGDVKKLFTMLRAEPHKRYLTLGDIDPRAAEAYYRSDHKASTLGSQSVDELARGDRWTLSPKHWPGRKEGEAGVGISDNKHTRITKWSEELGKRHRNNVIKSEKEEHGRQMGITTLQSFRKMLATRYGSTVAAWRSDIDPEGTNRITFSMYCAALDKVGGYTGSVKQLWNSLDPDCCGYFGLKELDPAAFDLLRAFREALIDKHGSLVQVWHKGLAPDGTERLDAEAFSEACQQMGLTIPDKEMTRILKLLLPGHRAGRRHVQIEDLKVLLIGVEKPDRRQIWLGDEPAHPLQSTLGTTAKSALGATGKSALGSSQGLNSTLGSTAGANELPVHGKEDLVALLQHKFGSLYSGWFRHLDVTEAGRVPMGEFVKRAKAIGVSGNVNKLFREIDVRNRGYIELQDLSVEVWKMIDDFQRLATKKYGSLAACFRSMDAGKKGNVNLEEFIKGCSLINYPGDARKLFMNFRPEKGRLFLFLEDWGHGAVKEQRRLRSMSPRSPANKDLEGSNRTEMDVGSIIAIPKTVTELRIEDNWSWQGGKKQYLDMTCLVYNADHEQVEVADGQKRELFNTAMRHSGDMMHPKAPKGRHVMQICLGRLPKEVSYIYFSVSVSGGGSFADQKIADVSLGVLDQEDKKLAHFDVFAAEGSTAQTVLLCVLKRRTGTPNKWLLRAIGDLGKGSAEHLGDIEKLIFSRRPDLAAGADSDGGTAGVGIGRRPQAHIGKQDSCEMSLSSTASTTYPDGRPVSRGGLSGMTDSRPASRADRLGAMLPEEDFSTVIEGGDGEASPDGQAVLADAPEDAPVEN